MTSLFSRLQKLNKEATPGPWEANAFEEDGEFFVQVRAGEQASWVEKPLRASIVFNGENCYADAQEQANVELAAECRNSLPAVLNLIEAARHWKEINDKAEERGVSQDTGTFIAWQDFCEALAVFVSGQEEPA